MKDLIPLMQYLVDRDWFALGVEVGKYFCHIDLSVFWHLYAICLYNTGNYEDAYDVYQKALSAPMSPKSALILVKEANSCVKQGGFERRFTNTSVDNIHVCSRQFTNLITFTMTTCKRLDLFIPTMNSFLNTCLDANSICRWLVVDDNSSEEDRKVMQETFPFIEFYWKTPEEKGHARSMNIIRNAVTTPFFFHIEDDWVFYEKRFYLGECLEVLKTDETLGQCLINKGYAETCDDIKLLGGIPRETKSGHRFFEHEHSRTLVDQAMLYKKYGSGSNCWYWPHFSLRPGLNRTNVIKQFEFDEQIGHFEMEYARKYSLQYKSAYLESIYCRHIGKLTSEQSVINSYDLNKQDQFKKNYTTYVVNLERRPDRYESFMKKYNKVVNTPCKRFNAVDGKKLKPSLQLQRLFETNRKDMTCGVVGCALSHIVLCIELLYSTQDFYIILEDDAELPDDFEEKVEKVIQESSSIDWDLIYLGHHIRKSFDVPSEPHLEQWDYETSRLKSLGGTFAYMISRRGAEKFLNYLEVYGMVNAIDTVQQKSADMLNIFYAVHCIVRSECYQLQGSEETFDSDIQKDKNTLAISRDERLRMEMGLYSESKIVKVNEVVASESDYVLFCKLANKNEFNYLKTFLATNNLHWYVIEGDTMVIGNQGKSNGRLMRNGKFLSVTGPQGRFNVDEILLVGEIK